MSFCSGWDLVALTARRAFETLHLFSAAAFKMS